MRRVLFLSYGFPPRGGGGVQRTAKFAKYLPDFNWLPTVVTPDWSVGAPRRERDRGLQTEVGGTKVVLSGPPCLDEKRRVWRWLGRTPVVWRFASSLRRNLQYPDYARRWIRDVTQTARPLLQAGEFDAIYSTSPPVAAHVAAMTLKRECNLPWIADFRDPWTGNHLHADRIWRLRRRIDESLERRVYRAADVVVANTNANRKALITGHALPPEKVVTIPNGYDEADFTDVQAEKPLNIFRVTYCGSTYGDYNPETFQAVFERFLRAKPNARAEWTIAGTACRWAESIKDDTVKARLNLLGYIPHDAVPQLLLSSHLLVLALPPGCPFWVPGKLYEYIRSGTPTLAICDVPSEVEGILETTGRGKAFCHGDAEGAAAYLNKVYARWAQGERELTLPANDRVAQYERRMLTARLAQQLDEVSIKQQRNPAP